MTVIVNILKANGIAVDRVFEETSEHIYLFARPHWRHRYAWFANDGDGWTLSYVDRQEQHHIAVDLDRPEDVRQHIAAIRGFLEES